MKYNTQNAKIKSITEKTLIVGIDVGSETHFARAFDWRNYEYSKKPLEFSNTEAGFMTFKAWMEDIAEKHGKDVVIPGMEPTGHYWFNLGAYLQDNGMKPVHVNPHHVKKSKELDDNNPNKNDRKDPKTIAALVNEGRFSYPYGGFWFRYKCMTPLEKAQSCGFTRLRSYDVVEDVVKLKFKELGRKPTVDELMEETELLYKGMCELVVKAKMEEILEAVEKSGLPFICWTPREKAELLQFQLDDNSYNMQLYNAVCKACDIDTSDMDEVFEDYQAIYDKTVEMQEDKEVGSREGGRGRVR